MRCCILFIRYLLFTQTTAVCLVFFESIYHFLRIYFQFVSFEGVVVQLYKYTEPAASRTRVSARLRGGAPVLLDCAYGPFFSLLCEAIKYNPASTKVCLCACVYAWSRARVLARGCVAAHPCYWPVHMDRFSLLCEASKYNRASKKVCSVCVCVFLHTCQRAAAWRRTRVIGHFFLAIVRLLNTTMQLTSYAVRY